MKYKHIVPGNFLNRPNRFIAQVLIRGREETVHVKNTGRCRELLTDNALVYLEESDNPTRKTRYDLVAVVKGRRLINMDSGAPNKIVQEWILQKILFPDLVMVRPETKYGNSRFDFYIETKAEKILMEVKGVTLEENGMVRFPDAPSLRAVKHLEELIRAKAEGFTAIVFFVIQMESVDYFTPNRDTHPEFADALVKAQEAGVNILAYDCKVTDQEIKLHEPVEIRLDAGSGIDKKEGLNGIPDPLLKWYDTNRRILPWREEATPYRVWISEIMLQQTRVEAVKPYFDRFMDRLPDIESLAAAEEEELLKLWEGLGYYNRVRNLKKAAVRIMSDHNGLMPEEYDEILKLNGIGSYTAGAVASIAYGKPVPAVDGNVLRVISRIRADDALISDPKVRKKVEQDIAEIIPFGRPGDFNQAIMELGAVICVPNGKPHCENCPLAADCRAHLMGREMEYPKKTKLKARKIEEKTVLIVRDDNKIALRKRVEKGLLAGMYEFPTMENFHTPDEVIRYLREVGFQTLRVTALTESKFVFTHKEWHMRGYLVWVDELQPAMSTGDWIFIEPSVIKEQYPVPSAFAAYMKYLEI